MWMRVVDRPGARVFASLNAVEAMSRALIAGILPLEAERLIQDALRISVLYTVIGVVAFLSSFLVPLAMRRLPRRWIFSIGVACMVVAPLLLMLASAGWFSAALQFRAFAVVAVNIALNLYILDYIRRRDFVSSEPIRLAYLGGAWCVGPALGIYLYTTFGLAAVCLPSAACAVLALAYFWVLRLREHPTVAPARGPQPMPWQYLRRYLRQPRLRLAWFIPFGRSTFWTSFFVYPPIYIVRNGGDEVMVAVMLSGGQALLFIAPLFGRLGARHGIRRIIIGAAFGSALVCLAAGFSAPGPWATVGLFFVASIGAVALDALGNIPFLRAVHAFERAEMTSVFRTYIEASQLLPAAVFALVLTVAPLQAVFVVVGMVLLGTAWMARYLPRRL